MKKKFVISFGIILLLALALIIVSMIIRSPSRSRPAQTAPDTPDAMAPCLIYEGERYFTTGLEMPVEVDESAIVGHITSVVPYNRLPENEGEANFGSVGDPIAMTSDGLLVLWDHEWTLFQQIPD